MVFQSPVLEIVHVGGVLSILVFTFGHVASFPALSFTFPGDVFRFPCVVIVELILSAEHPLMLSVHFPRIITLFFVQFVLSDVDVHVGGVLSILVFTVGHGVSFPALSFAIPGDVFLSPSTLTVLSIVAWEHPLRPSVHVPWIDTLFFVQFVLSDKDVHAGGVLSMFNLAFSCDNDSIT